MLQLVPVNILRGEGEEGGGRGREGNFVVSAAACVAPRSAAVPIAQFTELLSHARGKHPLRFVNSRSGRVHYKRRIRFVLWSAEFTPTLSYNCRVASPSCYVCLLRVSHVCLPRDIISTFTLPCWLGRNEKSVLHVKERHEESWNILRHVNRIPIPKFCVF